MARLNPPGQESVLPCLIEDSLFIGEVGGVKPESADGKAESLGQESVLPYLYESLFIAEASGVKPEFADCKAESPGTGEGPHPTYLKSPCSLERSAELNQSLQTARLNPPGQERALILLT